MKNESKDLTVKGQNAVAQVETGSSDDINAWGAPELSSQDIIIPRILIMQPMSTLVTDGKAAMGEVIDSLTGTKLAGKDQAFEFVPFFQAKTWVEYDVTAGEDIKNKKFLRMLKITPENEDLPYKDEERLENGQMIKVMRDRCANFYILLKSELDQGIATPYVLTTRRSSAQAGKALTTQMFVKNRAAGKGPAHVTMSLKVKKEQDENVYFVPEISVAQATPEAHVKVAFEWLKKVQGGKAKLDEASFNEEAPQATQAGVKASGASIEKGPAQF